MPKIIDTTRIHEGNGKGSLILPVPGGNRLADRLRQQLHSDKIEIRTTEYVESDKDETGSFADLDQRITRIQFLVPGWIPYGMLTGLVGGAKSGKSLWAMWNLVRPVVTGCNWFTSAPNPAGAGYAVWCDTERRAAVNLSRAKAWGLPMDRIKTPFKDPTQSINLDSQDDLDRLYSVVCKYRATQVTIDSFRGGHRGDENNSRIVAPLHGLASIAETTGAQVTLIHHVGKMVIGQEVTINSARGSSAFLAMVAAQIVIDVPDTDHPDCRRFRVLGENLGIAPKPKGFVVTDRGLEITDAPMLTHPVTQEDKAREWLQGRMEPGVWYLSKKLLDEAKQFSLSGNAVQRARENLGIALETGTIRRNAEGNYEWRLP